MIRKAACLIIVMVLCIPVLGHHSLDAEYFLNRKTIIEGVLVKIDLANPHSLVVVDVRNANGRTGAWHAEWVDPRAIKCAGIDPTVLKAGDKVRIAGAPARDAAKLSMLIESITRPSDGWTATGLKDTRNDLDARKCSLPMPGVALALRGSAG